MSYREHWAIKPGGQKHCSEITHGGLWFGLGLTREKQEGRGGYSIWIFKGLKKRFTHPGEASLSVSKQFVVHTEDNSHFPISSLSSHPISSLCHFLPSSPPISGPSHPPFRYQTLCDLGAARELPHASMLWCEQLAAEDVLVEGQINRRGFHTQSWGDRQRLWEKGAWPLENTILNISPALAKLTLAPCCACTCRSFIFLDSTNWASRGVEG